MKFNYIAIYDGNPHSGVTKKIIQQTSALRALGFDDPTVRFLTKHGATICTHDSVRNVYCDVPPCANTMAKIKCILSLRGAFDSIEKQCKADEVVYFRNILPPQVILRRLKIKGCIILVEMVSNTFAEARVRKAMLAKCFYRLLYSKNLRWVDGIVGITEEIIAKNVGRGIRKPFVAIGNGVDVESVPIRTHRSTGSSINLICVARVAPWHGLDRVIEGLSRYSDGRAGVHLHIVGEGSAIPTLRELVSKRFLSHCVTFHGFMSGRPLDVLYDTSDIAVSNLATHRKGLASGSPLKSREYCARGIPFIYSGTDVDFPESFPYVMRVDANDTAIGLDGIVWFARQMARDNSHPTKMREFAANNVSWLAKMQKVKGLINTIADGRHHSHVGRV